MYVEQLLLRYWQRGSACASTTSYILYVTVIKIFFIMLVNAVSEIQNGMLNLYLHGFQVIRELN